MNDISNMKLPKLPNPIEYSGIERDAQFIRFQNELLQYERKLSNFIDKIYEDGKPLRELGQVGKEASKKLYHFQSIDRSDDHGSALSRLDRPAIRRLKLGEKITEHGITAERLSDILSTSWSTGHASIA